MRVLLDEPVFDLDVCCDRSNKDYDAQKDSIKGT